MNIIKNNEKIKALHFFKNRNFYTTLFSGNIDVLAINSKNAVVFKYVNMPRFKTISIDKEIEKTSIIVLPLNASLGINIGDVLVFESEHVI